MYRDQDAERDLVNSKRFFGGADTHVEDRCQYQLDRIILLSTRRRDGDTNGFLPVYGTLLPNPIGTVSPHVNLGDPNSCLQASAVRRRLGFSHDFNDMVAFHSDAKWTPLS